MCKSCEVNNNKECNSGIRCRGIPNALETKYKFKECMESYLSKHEEDTIKKIDIIENYKSVQLKNISSMESTVSNLISIFENANECGNDQIISYKQQAISTVQQYYDLSNKTYEGKALSKVGDSTIYGTFDINGIPVYGVTGYGGIRNDMGITGTITISGTSMTSYTYNISQGDDNGYVASKLRDKFSGKLVVTDSTEMSISLIGMTGITGTQRLILDIYSVNQGNRSGTFFIEGKSSSDYEKLLENIQYEFSDYIFFAWYDSNTKLIRIVFKEGYTIGFRSSINNIFTVSTYINDLLITSQLTKTDNQYIYGYLEFYSNRDIYTIQYPLESLNNTLIEFNTINDMSPNFKLNVTLNLKNIWTCKFENLFGVFIRYDRNSVTTIYSTVFYSWAYLLNKLVNILDFSCDFIDRIHRKNIICTLMSLSNMLQKISVIIENEKDQINVIKKDYTNYAKNTNNSYFRIY